MLRQLVRAKRHLPGDTRPGAPGASTRRIRKVTHAGEALLAPWALALALLLAACAPAAPSASKPGGSGPVLLVGSYHGKKGAFNSIQAAVNAAEPGDWILVGPGDYHTPPSALAGVVITKPDIHLRGMNRNTVIVDGTLPSATSPCPGAARYQDLGPGGRGRNGIVVYKAAGVSIQNLTACNFLSGPRGASNGDQIYFDGGAGSGRTGLGAFAASYLTATSTFTGSAPGALAHLAEAGVAVRNARGPGMLSYSFSSNMATAAFYAGGCSSCNLVLDHVVGETSVLGFSATNAGGHLAVTDSLFEQDKTGVLLTSANNADPPPPQNGACPHGRLGPRGTHSCTIISHDLVLSNNNPNVPGGSDAGAYAVIGSGIVIAGGRNDLVYRNVVAGNGSWGILMLDIAYQGKPPRHAHCQKGITLPSHICFFPAAGNEVAANLLASNGSFGNPGNSDLAEATLDSNPGNCWTQSTAIPGTGALTTAPAGLQLSHGTCSGKPEQGALSSPLGFQLACATQLLGPCSGIGAANVLAQLTTLLELLHASTLSLNAPGTSTEPVNYPSLTQASAAYPALQPTMPDPCKNVPANPWCPSKR